MQLKMKFMLIYSCHFEKISTIIEEDSITSIQINKTVSQLLTVVSRGDTITFF